MDPTEKKLAWAGLVVPLVLFAGVNAYYIQRMRKDPEGMGPNARKLYNFDTLLFPAMWGAAGMHAKRSDSRSLHWAGKFAFASSIACVLARIYATHIEPKILKVERIALKTPKLRKRFRLLHITDMETDAVRRQEPRVLHLARHLAPDLIFYTGDLMNPIAPATYDSEMPKMERLWHRVNPRYGKLFVTGEVDQPIMRELVSGFGGLEVLNGEQRIVRFRGGRLNIFGLSFEQSCAAEEERVAVRNVVQQWLNSCRPGDVTVLAGHRPDYILAIDGLEIDLCLAGHTHGGQIQVPLVGPLATQSQVPNHLAMGFHDLGHTRLNVSAGVGFEHSGGVPAIRVNCPPEMSLIELVPG